MDNSKKQNRFRARENRLGIISFALMLCVPLLLVIYFLLADYFYLPDKGYYLPSWIIDGVFYLSIAAIIASIALGIIGLVRWKKSGKVGRALCIVTTATCNFFWIVCTVGYALILAGM
jgi:ABC-type amino acid transport system permease subunit